MTGSRKPISSRRNRTRSFDVGYGKPPRAHRFKPGQSGNPNGRPKGAKSEATIMAELLNKTIKTRTGQRTRKITVHEAILLRIAEDSLRGNTKSATFILNRASALTADVVTTDINDDDQAVLQAYLKDHMAELASDEDKS